ncbi:Nitroreductase [Hortaea werneckii]|nr:Nitroreductase [Hortaea werneckii]KAI6997917.1 Nitroreductase [Hortaea werneckii]KAI7148777.1 Nitroreductase [Hortaea werneckii]KAI7180180.1 Nitroreductase [Hortaea werneckii]KAI7184886.1 Nitroreductase [Hortaea werneckii]
MSTPSSAETMSFKDATHLRRSIYALNKQSPIADTKIEEIVRTALKEVPSSFNSQSTRLVVLLKDDHDKFWDIVRDILKAHVPEDKWEHTGNRIKGFRGGYGTILFYEDPEPIKALQTKLPTYADKFPTWSEHTSAMHQYMLWTALEAEGFGCNLQHYNPLPDQKASAEWNIPLEWSLKAQLVFGGVEKGAREALKVKDEVPMAERLFVHGASS